LDSLIQRSDDLLRQFGQIQQPPDSSPRERQVAVPLGEIKSDLSNFQKHSYSFIAAIQPILTCKTSFQTQMEVFRYLYSFLLQVYQISLQNFREEAEAEAEEPDEKQELGGKRKLFKSTETMVHVILVLSWLKTILSISFPFGLLNKTIQEKLLEKTREEKGKTREKHKKFSSGKNRESESHRISKRGQNETSEIEGELDDSGTSEESDVSIFSSSANQLIPIRILSQEESTVLVLHSRWRKTFLFPQVMTQVMGDLQTIFSTENRID